jgi:hypothetical protein
MAGANRMPNACARYPSKEVPPTLLPLAGYKVGHLNRVVVAVTTTHGTRRAGDEGADQHRESGGESSGRGGLASLIRLLLQLRLGLRHLGDGVVTRLAAVA